ncbi:MAG: hypothetical protein L0332_05335 [Chloroflexi bacterium]|nr:hypothetical protein [Chloroflexota bacterium]MCI0579935.1 hypothetical protein [Chloroflexota bacterium]MCI0646518.1 hypothetical protein [Chloroflexota bacterium]MCI0726130.1 hypothetical protein [Chloroflexota bacterium]
MEEVLLQVQAAQAALEPQFNALRAVMGALKTAAALAGEEKADALPMQKALAKLETAAAGVESQALDAAVAAFGAATQTALDNLAFEFARDLRDEFAARGETVEGRPPTLVVGLLTFNLEIAARKGQWLYGKEPLTRPISLSLTGILKAYDQQVKNVVKRTIDTESFLQELHEAWNDCIKKRDRKPAGGRINVVEVYSQLTLNRQSARFWNAPSRSTFKDYDRPLFVRDLALLRDQNATSLAADGKVHDLRLGVATKSQAEQASRSIWLPGNGLDGEYYGDVTFEIRE